MRQWRRRTNEFCGDKFVGAKHSRARYKPIHPLSSNASPLRMTSLGNIATGIATSGGFAELSPPASVPCILRLRRAQPSESVPCILRLCGAQPSSICTLHSPASRSSALRICTLHSPASRSSALQHLYPAFSGFAELSPPASVPCILRLRRAQPSSICTSGFQA